MLLLRYACCIFWNITIGQPYYFIMDKAALRVFIKVSVRADPGMGWAGWITMCPVSLLPSWDVFTRNWNTSHLTCLSHTTTGFDLPGSRLCKQQRSASCVEVWLRFSWDGPLFHFHRRSLSSQTTVKINVLGKTTSISKAESTTAVDLNKHNNFCLNYKSQSH